MGRYTRSVLVVISIALAHLALAVPAPQGSGEEAIPKTAGKQTVVARVNGAAITLDALASMMSRSGVGKGHGAEASKGKDALRKEALDRLISEELAYQKARADGLNAGPDEVNRRMEEVRARMGGAEGLKTALEKEMRTEEEFRAVIERDIVVRRIFAREVFDKITLSEDDLAGEYEREKGKFVKPEKVVVNDIVFFLKPDESASVERAEEIRKKVLEDRDRNPMNLIPDGTFIAQEIEIQQEKEKELYREAIKLKTGEISGVIVTGDSLHIIQLIIYTPMKQLALSDVRGMLEGKLKAKARQERMRQWDVELRKGAVIEIMDAPEMKQ